MAKRAREPGPQKRYVDACGRFCLRWDNAARYNPRGVIRLARWNHTTLPEAARAAVLRALRLAGHLK